MEDVEQEFKGFEIKLAQEEDFEILNQHLRDNFFCDEPLNTTVGFSEGLVADIAKLWKLKQGLSLVAFDKATNKVAGCNLILVQCKDQEYPETTTESSEAQKVSKIHDFIEECINVYEQYGIDRYAEFFIVSVERELRQRGLAMQLYNRSVTLLREKGFTHVKCAFTSLFSRRNGEKLGFAEHIRKQFFDFVDENGKQIASNASPNDFCTLNILKL